jgi:hypothetical protein
MFPNKKDRTSLNLCKVAKSKSFGNFKDKERFSEGKKDKG